ncbi:hypothetical protein K7432_015493 [Basidiobolus ranarum]|uniref:Chitin-binding type-1 domain-containing protein n=1 Tax=Basidiobolus ranarum TaxID=34480 RepID=A0ABR2VNL1_9FUNG
MKFFLSLLGIALAATSIEGAPQYISDRCGSEYGTCAQGLCCNQLGYCGSTSDYCSTGCQENFGSCDEGSKIATTNITATSTPLKQLNEQCGSGFGSCAPGLCCSEWGWCGYSSDHCTGGCQEQFGTCNTGSTTTTTNTPTSTPLKQLNEQCGSNDGTCAPGLCCSEWGWCGYSSDHCTGGCQKLFGTCNNGQETTTSISSTDSVTSSSTINPTSTFTSNTATTTDTATATSTPIGLKYLDEQCGSKYGSCAPGLCCGQGGYCGYTSDHCSTGCQKDFGICDNKIKAECADFRIAGLSRRSER